jgi:hypothetical protein
MPAIDPERSVLLVVDFQSRCMPAIEDGATVIANARRTIDGAELFRSILPGDVIGQRFDADCV